MIDMKADDPYMSHFFFSDVNRILPSNDAACPGDGSCKEDNQVLMQFRISQDTDLDQVKRHDFFQLNLPHNVSRSEKETLSELILKNETEAQGDLYIEGSQRQLKSLLKKYLILKPACLFDAAINVEMKIMYAFEGQYSEGHTRTVNIDVAQVQKQIKRQELDHQLKYRFLHVTDTGDLVPIFSKAQSINAGAGDVLLAFKGVEGSGFEQCEVTTQTLTRGSQYQTSFLPEMNKDQLYTVRVEAKYKDYLPINFDLQVKYYPNLDGKIKFVDLGTHVFYKKVDARPQSPYKFTLANVLDDGVDDDNDDYVFELNNGRGKDYYELDGQENIIEIP